MSRANSTDGTVSLEQRYQETLAEHGYQRDNAQLAAVQKLEGLTQLLTSRVRRFGFWQRRRLRRSAKSRIEPVRGLYLWGDVGRGKTFLMDLFYECLPFSDKLRSHFHRFMQGVHNTMTALEGRERPLEIVAHRLAQRTRIICFDEFVVSDIGDAMILANLFSGLFRRGVSLVATSNVPPAELYKEGLQRQRFIPAVELLEKHTDVFHLEGQTDYRLRALERAEIYHCPLDEAADRNLERYFRDLAPERGERDVVLDVLGRQIRTRRCADGIVWFDFDEVCGGRRSQNDYIEIARCYAAVLVSNVPELDETLENEARRFIALVDEFYDRNVKLIVSAALPLAALYRGSRLAFEFQRTRSRLVEMQSRQYLARPHLA